MEITDIQIRRVPGGGRMRASVSVVFDEVFAVHDIKVIEGQDRLFLAMPSRKLADGSYRDIVHPISHEMRAALERSILEVYHNTPPDTSESGGRSGLRQTLNIR